MAEFDLRCNADDWDTAARVLTDIDFHYLLLWGYYKLTIELHERLQGKIADKWLSSSSVGNLGLANRYIGNMRRAIDYYQQVLSTAREINNKFMEGSALGNLGNAYSALGDVKQAIDYQQQALSIAREIGNKRSEGIQLGNLGNRYTDLGDVQQAIDYQQQALTIAREIGDKGSEGNQLGSLGNAYGALGDVQTAIDYQQQALSIAREIGNKSSEGSNLGNLGLCYLDLGEYGRAIQNFQQAVQLADESGYMLGQSYRRYGLAKAYLLNENLTEAKITIDVCLGYDVPENNHNAHVACGMITLRQGNTVTAHASFENTLSTCDEMLAKNPDNYDAKDAKGLALCALALLDNDSAQVNQAKAVFSEARIKTKQLKGHIGRVQRQFDALAQADEQGLLAGIRAAIAGE